MSYAYDSLNHLWVMHMTHSITCELCIWLTQSPVSYAYDSLNHLWVMHMTHSITCELCIRLTQSPVSYAYDSLNHLSRISIAAVMVLKHSREILYRQSNYSTKSTVRCCRECHPRNDARMPPPLPLSEERARGAADTPPSELQPSELRLGVLSWWLLVYWRGRIYYIPYSRNRINRSAKRSIISARHSSKCSECRARVWPD